MGTGVEMIKQSLTLAILATLAACGPLNEGNLGKGVVQQIGSITGLGPDPAPPSVPPNIANAEPGEVLLVTILNRNAVAPLSKVRTNANTITWISPGDVSMTFRDGILISTRGLDEDLLGANIDGVRDAIRAGGGIATRQHSFLTSLDEVRTRAMTCIITKGETETLTLVGGAKDGTKFDESCTGEMVFTNSYWVDPETGDFLRTLQVVSGGVGYIRADQL